MDLTVRSGARTHWLRAALPTRSRPSSDRPTNEGRMGSPSSSKTCGWLSAPTTATSLLVVPRSMPTITSPGGRARGSAPRRCAACGVALVLRRKRLGFGHAHLGEAEHAVAPQVAAAHLADHL